jgi:hypothetical protein
MPRPAAKKARFPKLAETLKRAHADKKHPTLREIEEELNQKAEYDAEKISQASISAYLTGQRMPRPEIVRRLADYFYAEDEELRTKFIADIEQKRKTATTASHARQPRRRERTDLRVRTIRIGLRPYPPFSDVFFEPIGRRFASMGQLKCEWFTGSNYEHSFLEALDRETTHVVMGEPTTLKSLASTRSFDTPFRMSLTAIAALPAHLTMEDREEILNTMREALIPETQKGASKKRTLGGKYQFLLLKRDFGYDYVESLGYLESAIALLERPMEEEMHYHLASNMVQRAMMTPAVLFFLVSDELTCLQVLSQWQKSAGDLGSHDQFRPHLVFPLISERAIEAYEERLDLVEYRLGIQVHQDDADLGQYFNAAFPLYLRTERATTAKFYFELYEALVKAVSEALASDHATMEFYASKILYGIPEVKSPLVEKATQWLLAHLFARYVLGFTRDNIADHYSASPWRFILLRARDRIMEHLRDDKASEIKTIAHVMKDNYGRLEEIFDVTKLELTALREKKESGRGSGGKWRSGL